MAIRPRIYNGIGMVGQLPDLKLTPDGRMTPLVAQTILNAVIALVSAVNGKLTFGNSVNSTQAGNLDAQWIEWLFVTANAEEIIPHGLGRKAAAYIVCAKDRACDLYDSNRGSWDEQHLRLKCSVAGSTVLFLVI